MGKYKAQEKYDAANTRQIRLKLNLSSDVDILDRLNQVGNIQGFIKELIRMESAMPKRYIIRDHEAGNEIDGFATKTEAIMNMKMYVYADKREGIYTREFYEIYDTQTDEIVDVSE